ncbi:MAG: 23S rRNA pseudouridine(1911/1915/1917) synthase RluD [Gammaproteobacteria bacterium]|nr:23S rRNA pseudouridine(1911/1915/1917) synthase RluD [Gammaproteobacteria bacterium]
MNEVRRHEIRISSELGGRRLDQALAAVFEDYSRTMLTTWIREGRVSLNNRPCRPRDRVAAGDRVALEAVLAVSAETVPEPVEFATLHEDRALIVVDKPAGLVVHPGAGNSHRTLVNGLLHRYPELAALPRAGLVHRLDKDTSGLLVVARTPRAFQRLTAMMAEREIHRTYAAIVHGVVVAGGTIEASIGRDRRQRTRMRIAESGREAVTHYRVTSKFREHTLLEIALETGRTHQIRVHLQYVGSPIVGDPTYGLRQRVPAGAQPELLAALRGLKRQALHALRLAFAHPSGRGSVAVEAPLPTDLVNLLAALAQDTAAAPHQ